MNALQAYEEETDLAAGEFAVEFLPQAGLDDRRAHVRAYDRWIGMLRGRACPSIEDLEPSGVAGPRDILIDLQRDEADPDLVCIGGALIADCGRRGMKRLSQVPRGSFLSLLTAHYRQVVFSRQPIAFEGEQDREDGRSSTYRGILLPLSSDGQKVDFVHGMISWREFADDGLAAQIAMEIEGADAPAPHHLMEPIWPAAL